MSNEFLIVLAIIVFLSLSVATRNAIISVIGTIFTFFVYSQLTDVGIDAAVVAAEQFDLINLPDSVCPTGS